MVTQHSKIGRPEWAFLVHRLPREPSAPRIALWRALRRLGAVMVSDGLVALPADERTIEHFEWLAAGIAETGGTASVWVARPSTVAAGERLAEQSRKAADGEYQVLIREAQVIADAPDARRAQRRLRRQLRLIDQRDFFAAPSGPVARAAVEALAREVMRT